MTERDFAPDLEDAAERLSGQPLDHFKSRIERAKHILEELVLLGVDPGAPLRVLFAGCGIGFIPYVLARHTDWTCVGGELDEECIRRYPWVRRRVSVGRLDVTAMPFADDTFDVVICNHVIEHVPAWETLVQELHRVARPSGLVYLATPNIYRPAVPLHVILMPKKNLARRLRIALHAGFSLAELKRLFEGFSQVHPFNRTHAYVNCPPLARPLIRLLPSFLYDSLLPTNVIIARK